MLGAQPNLIVVAAPPLPPVAAFSAAPTSGTAPLTVTFTDTSTGSIANRYWQFGDGTVTNTIATTVSHTYATAGTNTVSLVVSGPGGASTSTQPDLIVVEPRSSPSTRSSWRRSSVY